MLLRAGFSSVSTEKYFVHDDLQDHFLMSSKYKPERYLIPEMRNNTSAFTVFADQDEVNAGLKALEADINSGKINEIIQSHENELGDYLFFIAER